MFSYRDRTVYERGISAWSPDVCPSDLGSHVGATSRKVPGMSTDTASSTGVETQVAALGTILSIWAHPDDETYLAGATMAAARALGQRVVCASATAGEHGTDDPLGWPPERLGAVRRWEAAAAMAVLGVHEQIGRASCRERVCQYGVDLGGSRLIKKKTKKKQ